LAFRRLNEKKLKALFVLSIVAPLSLLTTLRLAGILQGPITITETTTLEPIKWEFQRPNQSIDILNELGATSASDELSANMYILILSYHNNSQFNDDNDYLRMLIKANSTVANSHGFIESVRVVFRKDSQASLVDWLGTSFNFENLSLVSFSSGWTHGERYETAYVALTSANHTRRINFSAIVEWSLLTPKNQTHQMEVDYEFIYFNATAYKKIIQPFQLKIIGR